MTTSKIFCLNSFQDLKRWQKTFFGEKTTTKPKKKETPNTQKPKTTKNPKTNQHPPLDSLAPAQIAYLKEQREKQRSKAEVCTHLTTPGVELLCWRRCMECLGMGQMRRSLPTTQVMNS